MSKVNPSEIAASYDAVAKINNNFDELAEALENTLSRDGTSPNQMLADLNMNHNRIRNVADAINNKDAVNLEQARSLAGPIGPPGGNIMSVGLFNSLSASDIPEGTNSVRTEGYLVPGLGSAFYSYDETVDSEYVADNPLTSFVAADNRGFKLSLDQSITPFMFGVLPTGNASSALQEFFDFIEVNDVHANWQCFCELSAGVTMGRQNNTATEHNFGSRATTVAGRLTIKVIGDIEGPVILNKMGRDCVFEALTIYTEDEPFPWLDRNYDVGIMFEGQASLQTWHDLNIAYGRIAGILISAINPGDFVGYAKNTFRNYIGQAYIYGCGSGSEWNDGATSYSHQPAVTYTSRVRNGAASTYGQTTTFTVPTLPPEFVVENKILCFVRHENELYPVAYDITGNPLVDMDAGTITVEGWIPSTSPASNGTIYYVYGGGFITVGGDAGIQVGNLTVTGCAIGVGQAALYPGHLDGVLQGNAIGAVVGAYRSGASVGGSLKGYFEGNDVDFYWNASTAYKDFTLLSNQALNLHKVLWSRTRNSDNSLMEGPKPTVLLNLRGFWHTLEKDINGEGSYATVDVALDRPYRDVVSIQDNNPTIRINLPSTGDTTVESDYRRLFGYNARAVDCFGTGADGQCTGTITVTCNMITGAKINGGTVGASVTFGSLTKPVRVCIRKDTADANNYLVHLFKGA